VVLILVKRKSKDLVNLFYQNIKYSQGFWNLSRL